MERKYKALRAIGTIYKILGVVVAAITVLIIAAACATSVFGSAALDQMGEQFGSSYEFGGILGGVLGGVMVSLAAVLYGGGLAVTLYALGEGVYLLIALEENTRATAAALQALGTRSTQPTP